MWQRWNQGTHIFEKSSDNGNTWTPLGLNAAIITEGVIDSARLPPVAPLPGNIAYKDQANIFTAIQAIQLSNPRLALIDTAAPVDTRRFDFYITGQSFYLQVLADAGGFQRNALQIDRAGNFTADGTIGCTTNKWRSNFHTDGGVIYPGHIADAGTPAQTSWYLGSHGAYGLYSNTGFYAEGSLYTNGWFYDNLSKSKGLPICYPQSVDPNSYLSTPHLPRGTQYMYYALSGKMMWIQLHYSGTINGGAPDIGSYTCTLPGGLLIGAPGGCTFMSYDGAGWGSGLINWSTGSNLVYIYASNLRPYQQGQIIYHYSSFWVPIQ